MNIRKEKSYVIMLWCVETGSGVDACIDGWSKSRLKRKFRFIQLQNIVWQNRLKNISQDKIHAEKPLQTHTLLSCIRCLIWRKKFIFFSIEKWSKEKLIKTEILTQLLVFHLFHLVNQVFQQIQSFLFVHHNYKSLEKIHDPLKKEKHWWIETHCFHPYSNNECGFTNKNNATKW